MIHRGLFWTPRWCQRNPGPTATQASNREPTQKAIDAATSANPLASICTRMCRMKTQFFLGLWGQKITILIFIVGSTVVDLISIQYSKLPGTSAPGYKRTSRPQIGFSGICARLPISTWSRHLFSENSRVFAWNCSCKIVSYMKLESIPVDQANHFNWGKDIFFGVNKLVMLSCLELLVHFSTLQYRGSQKHDFQGSFTFGERTMCTNPKGARECVFRGKNRKIITGLTFGKSLPPVSKNEMWLFAFHFLSRFCPIMSRKNRIFSVVSVNKASEWYSAK